MKKPLGGELTAGSGIMVVSETVFYGQLAYVSLTIGIHLSPSLAMPNISF